MKRKKDISVDKNLSFGPFNKVSITLVFEQNLPQDIVNEERDKEAVHDCGKDYKPKKEDSEEEKINTNPKSFSVNENKYILFPLLKSCQICGKPAFITRLFERGSLLIVSMLCENNHESKWYSQPHFHEMASRKILFAAAILYTGNTYQRIKNLSFCSYVSYNFIQKNYLFPTVHHIYTTDKHIRFDKVAVRKEIRLLRDGRCDWPGYSAKYGTYPVMESTSGETLNFQVCHNKIACSTVRMELD